MSRQPYDGGQFPQRNKTETEIRLDPRFDTEEATKSGHSLWKRRRLFEVGHKVGTTYEDSKIFDARFFKEKTFHILNKDTGINLTYKVLACNNPSIWETLEDRDGNSEFTVLPTKSDYQTSTEGWAFYKLQVKSASSSVEVEAYASGRK